MKEIKTKNKNYERLEQLGYSINITTTNGGWAYLYPLWNDARVPGMRIMFRSNNQSAAKLTAKAATTRAFSHLDKALLELLLAIKSIPAVEEMLLENHGKRFIPLHEEPVIDSDPDSSTYGHQHTVIGKFVPFEEVKFKRKITVSVAVSRGSQIKSDNFFKHFPTEK